MAGQLLGALIGIAVIGIAVAVLLFSLATILDMKDDHKDDDHRN